MLTCNEGELICQEYGKVLHVTTTNRLPYWIRIAAKLWPRDI